MSKKDLLEVGLSVAVCVFMFLGITFFAGCSKPTYKVRTQEVLIPIKCNLTLPLKPKEDGSFESHKALAIYYRQVEQIAKDCTKE